MGISFASFCESSLLRLKSNSIHEMHMIEWRIYLFVDARYKNLVYCIQYFRNDGWNSFIDQRNRCNCDRIHHSCEPPVNIYVNLIHSVQTWTSRFVHWSAALANDTYILSTFIRIWLGTSQPGRCKEPVTISFRRFSWGRCSWIFVFKEIVIEKLHSLGYSNEKQFYAWFIRCTPFCWLELFKKNQ